MKGAIAARNETQKFLGKEMVARVIGGLKAGQSKGVNLEDREFQESITAQLKISPEMAEAEEEQEKLEAKEAAKAEVGVPVAVTGKGEVKKETSEVDAEIDPSNLTPNSGEYEDSTCQRVASLEVHGVTDDDIQRTLLLTAMDLSCIRRTETYIFEKARQLDKISSRNSNIADTVDEVEQVAWNKVLHTLNGKMGVDPKFALMAAKMANSAKRPVNSRNHVQIDQTAPVVLMLPPVLRQSIIAGTINMGRTKVQQHDSSEKLTPMVLKQTELPPVDMVKRLLDPEGSQEDNPMVIENDFVRMISSSFSDND